MADNKDANGRCHKANGAYKKCSGSKGKSKGKKAKRNVASGGSKGSKGGRKHCAVSQVVVSKKDDVSGRDFECCFKGNKSNRRLTCNVVTDKLIKGRAAAEKMAAARRAAKAASTRAEREEIDAAGYGDRPMASSFVNGIRGRRRHARRSRR